MGFSFSGSPNGASGLPSQILGDAQQAVDLVAGVYKLVRPAWLKKTKKKDHRASLKSSLGLWFYQAFDDGKCRIPVLDSERFEMHLRQTNGVLEPRGKCSGESPWVYLLHALAIHPGIRPEDDVLDWKPAEGASCDMRGTAIALDVRGRAFCHLINLYRVAAPEHLTTKINGKEEECMRCQLSFGRLTWTKPDAGDAFATFEPDTMRKLGMPKYPMARVGRPAPLIHDRLWQAYEAVWAEGNGASDPAMAWPDPKTTSLHTRLECLIKNLRTVESNANGLIVTDQWLSHASNIKRRAMTNGGTDRSFLNDTYTTLVSLSNRRLKPLPQDEKDRVKEELQSCFFFENVRFKMRDRNVHDTNTSFGLFSVTRNEVLRHTLESYVGEDPQSWKGQLYASRELVDQVARMDTTIICENPGCVRILDFAEGNPLWNARVHLT